MTIPPMTDAERAVITELLDEAEVLATSPDGSIRSSAAPAHFVALLRDHEGLAPTLVADWLDHLAERGAAKMIADRRRRSTIATRTAKGTKVEAPRFAGVVRPDENGTKQFVQVELPGMTLAELYGHKRKLEAARNTYSRDIRLVADVIAAMEEHGFATAGEALEHLERAA